MSATVDLFWSFRSPYSCLATPGARRLELAALDAAIAQDDGASQRAEIDANQAALAAVGHWGVPTFAFEGEPFFGEDRIDMLRWWLGRRGLPRG